MAATIQTATNQPATTQSAITPINHGTDKHMPARWFGQAKRMIAAVTLLLAGCSQSDRIEVVFECPDPAGKLVATFFRSIDGSRPGDQISGINIRPADKALDSNLRSFAFRYGYDAILHWQTDASLRIDYPKASVITHQEQVIFGSSQTFSADQPLRLDYRPLPSEHGYFITEQRCFNQPVE